MICMIHTCSDALITSTSTFGREEEGDPDPPPAPAREEEGGREEPPIIPKASQGAPP